MKATAVLVHGGWSNPADWRWVSERLVRKGVEVVALDLPSHRRPDATRAEDVAEVASAVESAQRPVVVVGWSYGGQVLSDLDVAPERAHLLYVACSPLRPVARRTGDGLDSGSLDLTHLLFPDDRTVVLDDRWFVEEDPAVQTMSVEVVEHLRSHPRRPISLEAALAPPVGTAWETVATTVLLGRQDHLVPEAERRRVAAAIGDTRVIESDHFILFRQPDLVADVAIECLTT
jgi:pimeloyl-ACP methyl ester carboxylesterase